MKTSTTEYWQRVSARTLHQADCDLAAREVTKEELAGLREIVLWAYNMGHTPQWMSRDQHARIIKK